MHVPHGPLRDYYDREADRHGWVRRLFDRTAVDYDRVERVMALGSGAWYRRRALARAGLAGEGAVRAAFDTGSLVEGWAGGFGEGSDNQFPLMFFARGCDVQHR